ncbi:diguanylate cyclase [Spongiibacter sp.]|uniref:diguanylate cyclase n=1 Tax=Spongiibacter sp. TaxID=2024860 RepID=UPI003563D75A
MIALIIEDSPTFQQIVADALQHVGIDVVVVGTAADGFEQIKQRRFDLICLDLNLPDINGLEFCRRFRAPAANRLLPVILLTGDNSDTLIQRALNSGITEVFRKSELRQLHDSLSAYAKRIHQSYQGRVMLIEDSATTRELLSYMLKKLNLEVDTFESAEEALVAFRQGHYDLVISDIILSGQVTGLGLVRAIRAMDDERCRIPILGLSALEDDARKIEMLLLGANDYAPKPVIEEEFLARVGNLIANKQLIDQVLEKSNELYLSSITDQLTGLYNRRYLKEISGQMIANALRHHESLSLLVIDLDFFKHVNDTHGHDTGDQVLIAVADELKNSCRGGDVAARFGGEEFVILLHKCDEDEAVQHAQRVLERLRQQRPAGLKITASIGVAALDENHARDFSAIFKLADMAVYAAKNQGRDQVVSASKIAPTA